MNIQRWNRYSFDFEDIMNTEGIENYTDFLDIVDQVAFIFVDGTGDPFGINDVMFKIDDILAEKYGLFDDADDPIIIDFTRFADEEFHELIREAIESVEMENELLSAEAIPIERQSVNGRFCTTPQHLA